MCLNDWFTLSFAQQNIKERLEKARKDTKKAQNLAEFISIYLKHVWGGGGWGLIETEGQEPVGGQLVSVIDP